MEPPPQGPGHADARVPPAVAPHRVRVPVNAHRWEDIAFLHWPVAPEVVASRLPDGLRPDTYDGVAWVGVTPFRMRVRVPGAHLEPPGAVFPETNVRTYVTGPDGRQGLWFLHMEASALWFVTALRAFGLPYVRRAMTAATAPEAVTYRSQPPPGQPGGHHVVVRVGAALKQPGGGPVERFLTARWAAYHRVGPLLLRTPVTHPPWPLHSATPVRAEVDGLFRAAGLPGPEEAPLVHFSPGVDVAVGAPRRVARR